ncbi:MAG: S-layer family protein, partial [Leptolyngbya sp. SIO3F4]|nr:S-layer family protein [Leptolyngbya sp. SIO3F4]
IVALSHPDSGLFSYGDMVLRSGSAVGGDAHYWSGGGFRVETFDGDAGALESPVDPIIRTLGDVVINAYGGSSLHILAGGSVDIGTAIINAPDAGELDVDFLRETVTLSDGTVVEIDGGAQPTLDVRAGVEPDALGTPPLQVITGFDIATDAFFRTTPPTEVPSSADIVVGDVLIDDPSGLVFLTNHYQPNSFIEIGNIVVTGLGIYGFGINTGNPTGKGGTVYLDSRNSIGVLNSRIVTDSSGVVGDVTINSNDTVLIQGNDKLTGVSSNLLVGASGNSGNIKISARNLEILNGAQLNASADGFGDGGNIVLDISERARFIGVNPVNGSPSGAFTNIALDGGNGGDLLINTKILAIFDGAQLGISTFGTGDGGDILLNASDLFVLAELNSNNGIPSLIFNDTSINSVGGDIRVTAGSFASLDGARIVTSTSGAGNAGDIILDIEGLAQVAGSDSITKIPSGIFSTVESSGFGEGGDIRVLSEALIVRDGARLISSTAGTGNAGDVILDIAELTSFEGVDLISGIPSLVSSDVSTGGVGRSGNVQIDTTSLSVLDGAQISSSIFGTGDAGNVILNVEDSANFAGFNSVDGSPTGVFSNVFGQGQGGNVRIDAKTLTVLDGAQLNAAVFGAGESGNVTLNVSERAIFLGRNPIENLPSGAFTDIALGGEGQGGDLSINAETLEVLDGAELGAATSGVGDAGNIALDVSGLARFAVTDPNNETSGVFTSVQSSGVGRAGNIQINAETLEVFSGSQIVASTFGVGDSGEITLDIQGSARFVGFSSISGTPSGAFVNVESSGRGEGGSLQINANEIEISRGATLFADSLGVGNAGNISLFALDAILVDNGTIGTNAESGLGGDIKLDAAQVVLRNDGDIQTFVTRGNRGGDIVVVADFLVALEDSDIVAFSPDGLGGVIDLSKTTLFSQNPNPISDGLSRGELIALDGNDQVDINATGGIASGEIFINDASFIENNLNELSDEFVDTATLTAGSCIVRTDDDNTGSFVVTGGEGLPQQPGTAPLAIYPTDDIQLPTESTATLDIQEAHGVYQLADGRLVLSHECGG